LKSLSHSWSSFLKISLIGLLTYGWSFQNDLFWDDEVLIINNPLIRSFSMMKEIFTHGFWAGSGNYYRPLSIFTYLLDYQVWGLDPAMFHLSNVLIHVFASLALFAVLRFHFSENASLWAALVYCVHPALSTNVVPVFGRNGLLESFTILGLIGVQRLPKSSYWGLFTVFCFAFGLLAKESALSYPALVTLYVWAWGWFSSKKFSSAYKGLSLSLWIMGGFYIVLREIYLPFKSLHTASWIADQPYLIRAWTALEALLQYLGLVFFPLDLHMERHFIRDSIWNIGPWLGMLIYGGLLAFSIMTWRRSQKRIFLFGFTWYCIGLIPVSNLIISMPYTLLESLLYIPIVGWIWILADFLHQKFKENKIFWTGAMGLVVLLFSFRSFLRVLDWKDAVTLYSKDIQKSPHSFLLPTNLGVEYFRRGELQKAKIYFEEALQVRPDYGTALSNLGFIQEHDGNLVAAEKSYRAAINGSRYELAYLNLAGLLLKQKKTQEAKRILLEGHSIYPFN
jgi:tetratricopeptide (TPR) repeat protein